MFVTQFYRKEFTDFVVKRKPIPDSAIVKSKDNKLPEVSKELILIWSDYPGVSFSLPNVVVAKEKSIVDFIAWVSTYFPHIRPFTSQCRVLSYSTARLLFDNTCNDDTDEQSRAAQTSLVIAEAVCHSVGYVSPSQLPFSAFERTLSFALSQGIRRFATISAIDWCAEISLSWQGFRNLSNQRRLELSPETIETVWRVLSQLKSDTTKSDIESTFAWHWMNESLNFDLWTSLFELLNLKPDRNLFLALSSGPRETRVDLATVFINAIALGPSTNSQRLASFSIGLIVSQINPGSLDYFELLNPVARKFPQSFLWYGLLTGIHPKFDANNFSDGLGWLIERELGRPQKILDRPFCDVALPELQLCYEFKNGSFGISSLTSGIMKAEIFPLITSSIRLGSANTESSMVVGNAEMQQQTLFDRETTKLSTGVIRDLIRKIEEITITASTLKRALDTNSDNTTSRMKPKSSGRKKSE